MGWYVRLHLLKLFPNLWLHFWVPVYCVEGIIHLFLELWASLQFGPTEILLLNVMIPWTLNHISLIDVPRSKATIWVPVRTLCKVRWRGRNLRRCRLSDNIGQTAANISIIVLDLLLKFIWLGNHCRFYYFHVVLVQACRVSPPHTGRLFLKWDAAVPEIFIWFNLWDFRQAFNTLPEGIAPSRIIGWLVKDIPDSESGMLESFRLMLHWGAWYVTHAYWDACSLIEGVLVEGLISREVLLHSRFSRCMTYKWY